MANNLHISYDLYTPGQNYEGVAERIKSLGAAIRVHMSFWYVESQYTAQQAADRVWQAMDSGDRIFVVDATNEEAAWYGSSEKVSEFIQQHWLS